MKEIYIKEGGRGSLVDIFNYEKKNIIAEIGVYNAEFSYHLWKGIPDIELYLIDPYKVYVDIAIKDTQEIHDTRYSMVKALVEQAQNQQYNVNLIRKTSVDAMPLFKNNFFDVVYIDADHNYESIKNDIEGWYEKIKPKGLLSGHDFLMPGVNRALGEFIEKNDLTCYWFKIDDCWLIRKEQKSDTKG